MMYDARWKKFGSEQGLVQPRYLLRLIYMIFGEFRYPIRLRAAIFRRSFPKHFYPKAVWDAGCGEGQTSFWLAKHFPHARIIGTDLRKENVERCDYIAQYLRRGNISFMQKDILEGRLQGIDLIVCIEVLEHIDKYNDALKIFSGSLVPGGFLVIHAPADNSFQSPTWGLRKFIHSKKNEAISHEKGQYHIRSGFNLDELIGKIDALGFQIVIKKYTFGPIAMFAHNIYEWTRSRTKIWQIITLWPLIAMGYLDLWLSFPNGGGILIVAQKR